MKIEILRTSCTKYKMNEKDVIKAGLKVEIMKVENLHKIVDRYDMMTPAFFVNGWKNYEKDIVCLYAKCLS